MSHEIKSDDILLQTLKNTSCEDFLKEAVKIMESEKPDQPVSTQLTELVRKLRLLYQLNHNDGEDVPMSILLGDFLLKVVRRCNPPNISIYAATIGMKGEKQ